MIIQSFQVTNATRPKLTESRWLCYDTRPPYFEDIALIRNFTEPESPNEYRWHQEEARLTSQVKESQGTFIETVPIACSHLCNQTYKINSDNGNYL